jgi:hypothetical protein
MQRGSQIQPEVLMDQLQHVAGGLAAPDLQVLAGALRYVDQRTPVGDHQGGWRILLDQAMVQIDGKHGIGNHLRECSPFVGRCRPKHGGLAQGQRQPTRYCAALVEVRVLVKRNEEIAGAVGRFRRAEKEIPAWPQRKMERVDQPFLNRPIQVDEDVSACDEIEMRERWVLDEIVDREQDVFPELSSDAISSRLAEEEPPQAFVRDVGDFRVRIEPFARDGNGLFVEIGGEYLEARRRLRHATRVFGEEHRNGVRLFTRGTPGYPHADGLDPRLALKDVRHHQFLERRVRRRVPEEVRDADQQILHEGRSFVSM